MTHPSILLNICKKNISVCVEEKIAVVGIGDGGNRALNTMASLGLPKIDTIAINTDELALDRAVATVKLQIGKNLTNGLGAHADLRLGHLAALESIGNIYTHLKKYTDIILVSGLGGGTGTGSIVLIAKIAKSHGAHTRAVVSLPFDFEGARRTAQANLGIRLLSKVIKDITIFENTSIRQIAYKHARVTDMLRYADYRLWQHVTHDIEFFNATNT